MGPGGGAGEVVEGKVRAAWEDGPAPVEDSVERPKTTFKDVGGMEAVKDEIRMKIIHPLTHPELYRAYGKSAGGGILLYGPPGCGKTHLARATAGEVRAGFLSVGINDVLEMWIGQSERNLHEVFERARENRPCVLFFDEVDALGASRSDLRQSSGRQLINQFLAELDGIGACNDGVLILAATNAPWHLDPAFRRPGRFDRILFVPPPAAPARANILAILLRGKPVQPIDFDHLAKKTDGFSGADLKAVVDVAVEHKLRQALKAGAPQPLNTRDLLGAAGSIRPTTKEWFATARNYALYANQGGIYDDIKKYLKL
jgi:SpoVK/Ycf46/Vps4 family AAA+-type ATPase